MEAVDTSGVQGRTPGEAEGFVRVFEHNVSLRSRTARGRIDVSSTPGKLAPLLPESEIGSRAIRNARSTGLSVWQDVSRAGGLAVAADGLRTRVESWNDQLTAGLLPSYSRQREELRVLAELV